MATTITLNLDTTNVRRALAQLGQRANPAIARALNRAAVSTRTLMVRSIAQDLGLRQKDVPVTTSTATATRLSAQVTASGKRIPLIDFRARQTKRGVTARLPGGAGTYPGAFITTVGRGRHTGVFKRRGPARLPIVELFGPSIPHVFEKYATVGLERGQESFLKNLISELRFAIQQAAA